MQNKIENIDDLIIKFLSGNALPEEAMLIEDWKNEDKEHLAYFLNSEKIFNTVHHIKAINTTDKEQAWKNVLEVIDNKNNVRKISVFNNIGLKLAASFILLISISVLVYYYVGNNKNTITVFSTTNQVLTKKLNDNTEVTILNHSSLIVNEDFGKKNRTVKLTGSANFNVVHKDELPFIVNADGFFIKDIGTKFSVRSSLNNDSIFVSVEEGTVLLFDSLGSELEIGAMQKAIYIKSQKKIINSQEIIKSANILIQFNYDVLEDVISELEKIYHTTIELENPLLNKCKITSTFTNESIDTVLTIITETLGLSYEKTSSGYLIKGQKCQS